MEFPYTSLWLTLAAIYLYIGITFADMIDRHSRRTHFKHVGAGYPVLMLLWPIFALILSLQ